MDAVTVRLMRRPVVESRRPDNPDGFKSLRALQSHRSASTMQWPSLPTTLFPAADESPIPGAVGYWMVHPAGARLSIDDVHGRSLWRPTTNHASAGLLRVLDFNFRIVGDHLSSRGLLDGGGWVTLWDNRWDRMGAARAGLFGPAHLGVWQITESVGVSSEACSTGRLRCDILPLGAYVQVVGVRYVAESCCVRGQLSSGGWITLANLEVPELPVKSAKLVAVSGAYKIERQVAVTSAVTRGSGLIRADLQPGEYVQIMEVMLTSERRVRGKVQGGGWISLIDTDAPGRDFATPVPVGPYLTMKSGVHMYVGIDDLPTTRRRHHYGPDEDEDGPSSMSVGDGGGGDAGIMNRRPALATIPHRGYELQIVGTEYVAEQQHVCGRLFGGAWIPLVDTTDGGFHWAKTPAQVEADRVAAEYAAVRRKEIAARAHTERLEAVKQAKAEERRREKEARTCPVPSCRKVFKSRRAKDQHVRNTHPFRCTHQGCRRLFASSEALSDHLRKKHGYSI